MCVETTQSPLCGSAGSDLTTPLNSICCVEETVGDGVMFGLVGDGDGVRVGVFVGATLVLVGVAEATFVGVAEATFVGVLVGVAEGTLVGVAVGALVGVAVATAG